MKENLERTLRIWTASVFVALLLASAPVASAQEEGAKAEQQKEEKHGTGIVPPGVKLEAQMPAGAAAMPFHFPQVATKTLANGLRVFVITDHRDPAIAARLVLTSAGAIQDPQGLAGVASMTASMLTQGTGKRSAQEIAQAIDFVGGTIRAQAESDSTYVTLSVVSKDLDLGMDLLSDVVLHPAFKQEELDRQKQQLLSGLQVGYNDASYLAQVAFDRTVFGGSPYGLPIQGTPDSARKLARDALAQFHDAWYAPNGALLAFAGDITPEAAFAAAEKYFGGWSKRELPMPRLASPAPTQGQHILVIDKPDAVQTQIRLGRLGIQRNDPDYFPLLVTNRVFGGGYNSRLNTEVRVNKGLTYGARSFFLSYQHAGAFAAGTFTRTEATVEATKLVVDLIGKMGTGAVTKQELDFARDYLAGVYPIESETAEQVADRVLEVAEYGLPADYNDTYQQKILGVGPEKVKQLAGQYFEAKNLDIVLVGNASKFRDDLKKAFPDGQWTEIPADELDLLSADLRKAKETAPAASPEALEHGSAILKAAVAAAGGEAVNKIESLEATATGEVNSPGGQTISVELRTVVAYPDHIRSDVKLPFGLIQQGYDGKSGWLASPQGAMDIPASFLAEYQRNIALVSGVGLYRQALAGKIEAQYVGEEEIEGKKAEAIQWNAAFGTVKLYFDPATHLLAGAHFHQKTPQGEFDTDQRWSDYRAVEGVQLPYQTVVYRDGAKFSTVTVQDVKLNTKPDPSVFSKPQK